jgi:hypothetical protein
VHEKLRALAGTGIHGLMIECLFGNLGNLFYWLQPGQPLQADEFLMLLDQQFL